MRIHTAISGYLGLTVESVLLICERAPKLYRRYLVPKRSGGQREIYHPAKETKALQSAAVDLLYKDDLTHDCVKGYIRGLSSPLVKNAAAHASHPFLLKLDFKDFFPSIRPNDFRTVCGAKLQVHNEDLDENDLEFLCSLFFVENRRLGNFLGIGAPSSPFISNWVMYNLDRDILRICDENGCDYTRYADDLCFSAESKEQLNEVEASIVEAVRECANPRLTFNDNKRRFASKWGKRRITGLTITPSNEVKVPRKTKRFIRSLLYKYRRGDLAAKERSSLAGYLAFLKDCEPTYFRALSLKYTADAVYSAMKKRSHEADERTSATGT